MKVHVNLDSQVRRIAGCSRVSIEVDASTSREQIVLGIADQGSDLLRNALLDEQHLVRQSILVFCEDELVSCEQQMVLFEGAELTLTTLMSGG